MRDDSGRVRIFYTTLRDGEQSPGIALNRSEKVEIALQLARLGVDIIEAGFPIASPGDFEAVQTIAREVNGPVICGLARANAADIDRAWEAVRDSERPRIHTFLSTSDIHIEHQLKATREDECAVNGIGERAGNASLEELIMLIATRRDRLGFHTNAVTTEIARTSRLVSRLTGYPVQPNKAIIGRNAFAHESGIHQDGVLKNPLTYEIMTPQSVGVPDSRLVLGKHSGRHALSLRCEQLGYQFDRRELDEVYRRFVVLADKIKHVADHHLLDLIREAHGTARRIPPAQAEARPSALAAAVGQNLSKPFPVPFATDLNGARLPLNSLAEHHAEQEDYLWGV